MMSGQNAGYAAGANITGVNDYLQNMMDLAQHDYQQVTQEQLYEGALRGIFASMDEYTEFFDRAEAEDFLTEITGDYAGVGIVIGGSSDSAVILKVLPDSPAQTAGLQAGDKIMSVDEQSTTGLSTDDILNLIKGEAGTEVTLQVVRGANRQQNTFKLVRTELKINPITYDMDGNIGYIKIDVFNQNTGEYLQKTLDEMDGRGINKIVLDLRNNPGGDVSQAVEAARHFVPQGVITTLHYRSPQQKDEVYNSDLVASKYKLTVLVNESTASASEILAGAIQDTGAGTIIGVCTYGKSRFQELIPLLTPQAYAEYNQQYGIKTVNAQELYSKLGVEVGDDELIGWAKVTVGEYFTPSGRAIDKVGLTPDLQIDDYELKDGIDIQDIDQLSQTGKPGLGDESLDIMNAEAILKLMGYDIDNPDTLLNEKSCQAVAKFQSDKGLYSYGVLDFATQQRLNEARKNLLDTIDTQYAQAVQILNQ